MPRSCNLKVLALLLLNKKNPIPTASHLGQLVLVIFQDFLLPLSLSTLGLYICVYIYLNSIPLCKCQSQRGKSTNCGQPPSPLKGVVPKKLDKKKLRKQPNEY